jgi:hypothetical protein
MATPNYNGNAQPNANGGLLGGLGSFYGGNAPSYAPAPIKAKTTASPLSPLSSTVVLGPCDAERITLIIPRDLIASGQPMCAVSQDANDVSVDDPITIVIPRSLLASSQT